MTKLRYSLSFFLMLVFIVSTLCAQTNYYVDAVNGNDQNKGTTPKTAWKTLAGATKQTLVAGDHLLFHAGQVWEGQLTITAKGSPEIPVLIDRYGKGTNPHIKGNGVRQAAVCIINSEYIVVQNLEVSNKASEDIKGLSGLMVSINDFGVAHNIKLLNLFIHDVNGSLVKAQGGGSGILIKNGGRNTPSTFNGLLVENCKIQRCQRNGIIFNGYSARSNWHPNLGVVVRKNILDQVPGDGIVPIGCDGALIEYNVMRNCPRLLPDTEAAAGIWPWSCDNTIIQYNEVSDHKAPWDGQGFDSDWNCKNTIIQYNYSHDNKGGFLLICNDGKSKLPFSVGNVGTIIRYNVSVNDGLRTNPTRSGIFSPIIHIGGAAFNSKIYNNIIYMPKKPSAITDTTIIHATSWNGFSDSTYFANNIFYSEGPTVFNFEQSTRNFFENNLYFGIQHNRPADPAAILADPQFKSLPDSQREGFDRLKCFMLQKSSPALRTGKLIPGNADKDFYEKKIDPQTKSLNIGIQQ